MREVRETAAEGVAKIKESHASSTPMDVAMAISVAGKEVCDVQEENAQLNTLVSCPSPSFIYGCMETLQPLLTSILLSPPSPSLPLTLSPSLSLPLTLPLPLPLTLSPSPLPPAPSAIEATSNESSSSACPQRSEGEGCEGVEGGE